MIATATNTTFKTLLIEDDESTRELFMILLQRRGHDVTGCADAESAWQLYQKNDYQLVLVDWMLPGKDGLSLCRDIRKTTKGRDTVLFVCTARREPEDLATVLSAGADDYLAKPADPDLFEIRVSVAEQHVRTRTMRKNYETALRHSENRFRRLFESGMMGIIFWDSSGQVVDANDAFLNLTGYTRTDLQTGQINWRKLTPQEFLPLDERALAQIATTGECTPFEKQYFRKNGTRVPILAGGASISESNGGIAFILDLTQRESLEHQLRQSQKMEAVGQLAGGIAHDFNNLLTVILGRAELLLSRLHNGDPFAKDIELISKTGQRAAALTRQLLAFSRRQILLPRVIDLNSTVSDISAMLRRLIGEDIDLKMVLAEDLGHVKVDPGQMEQVLVNIAVNARDAMPNGGTLIIETRNTEFQKDQVIERVDVAPGRYIVLTITDTGGGITPENIDRIFEPFFTTKKTGTGLGLSTVYGIIKQSGGHIAVYSEVDKGTSFKIYLPRVDRAVDVQRIVAHAEPAKGSESILVVEDDECVREVVVKFLQMSGYKVIASSSSENAIEITQQSDVPVNLFIVDLVTPGISGPELLQKLGQSRPDSKFLLMSGYTNRSLESLRLNEKALPFIQKPFSRLDLCNLVRDVLDNRIR